MTNQHEINFLSSSFNSPVYVNKNEEDWDWSFSKKDTNSNFLNIIIFSVLIIGCIIHII